MNYEGNKEAQMEQDYSEKLRAAVQPKRQYGDGSISGPATDTVRRMTARETLRSRASQLRRDADALDVLVKLLPEALDSVPEVDAVLHRLITKF